MFKRVVVGMLILLIVLPFSAPGAVCGVTNLFGVPDATPHAAGVPYASPAHVDDGTALLAPPSANIASRLKLTTGALRTDALLECARERGVIFVAGSGFFVDGTGDQHLRLSFSAPPPDRIEQGVARLAAAVSAALAAGHTATAPGTR